MNLRERLRTLNSLQYSRWFKIVASVVVLVLGIAAFGSYVVFRASHLAPVAAPENAPTTLSAAEIAKLSPEEKHEYEATQAEFEARKATDDAVRAALEARTDLTPIGIAVGAGCVLAWAVVWLGLGLTGLAILLGLAAVSLPLFEFGNHFWQGVGQFVGAVGALTFAFVALMELLRVLLSPSHPVTAIARNVVNEAVRMKVSLVFIVLLLLGLSVLPALLDDSTPLRYRVQNFISWGTGGTFWVIALLTVFLAVGTVAFEQRDRVIWQTMTKPVAAWQYLLGKWLGVVGVAAVLLGVSTTGVFLFTEYLRAQRAQGEAAPYVALEGTISEDRRILETQVLSAQRTTGVEMPELDMDRVNEEIKRRAELAQRTDSTWRPTQENLLKLETDLRNEVRTGYLTIEGGLRQNYSFSGLGDVKKNGKLVTFRYKASVGADDPRDSLRVTFLFQNMPARVQEVPLGQLMSMPVSPASIDEDGVLHVQVINGDFYRNVSNTRTMSFPPDGMSVAYPAGSYRSNFARVVVVLWLKLAFLAMVGVTSATFLSFAVASLVSFGVFLVAECSQFLNTSLDYYASIDQKGNIDIFKVLVRAIAVPVNGAFKFYGELSPTTDLVDGKMVEWSSLTTTMLIVVVVCAGLYATGVAIFRGRELATYSGQ